MASSTGTVNDAAPARSTSTAVLRTAISDNSRHWRYNRRVHLVAGSDKYVSQITALQAIAAQVSSVAIRCALL